MSIIQNNQVTIDTTVPTLSIGQVQLSADRRSTKEEKLADHERVRRIVIPSGHWGELGASINGESSQSLLDVLRTALVAIGNDRLRDTLTSEPLARTVALADYTVPALLAWSAETANSRGSITFTREQVEEWFTTSATRSALKTKHSQNPKCDAMLALVATRFATLAAKNHGLKDVSEVDKLTALIDPTDLEGDKASLITEMIGRLEHIKKLMLARAADVTVSMDDL